MPASRREPSPNGTRLARGSNHPIQAGRQHPYARPGVPALGGNYQASTYGNNHVRQVGPIRHNGVVRNSHGPSHSQLGVNYQGPPSRQHVSRDNGRSASSYPHAYDARNSDYSTYGPPQANLGNDHFPLPQSYPNVPQPFLPDDQFLYEGQQYNVSQQRQDPRYEAYLQRVANTNGPSPYLAAPSYPYANPRATTSAAPNEKISRTTTGTRKPEQTVEVQSSEKEAEKPKKGINKRATKAKRSLKAKGETRVKHGRLEYYMDSDTRDPQWGKSSLP